MEKKIVANNDNIKRIVNSEIERLGYKADLNHIDVNQVTDMNGLFRWSNFNGDISKWDVSNVEYMNWMFSNSKFNGDISQWDVSNVENMGGMFYNSSFNQDISNWDVSKVKNMDRMFYYSSFNQDISKWDFGNVRNMYWMFSYSTFNQDIDMWNVNFKAVEENPIYFILATTGSYTLIEKYAKALKSEKFDLAEKIKFKMKGIRFNYRYKDVNENKHLVDRKSTRLNSSHVRISYAVFCLKKK